ncbi:unnamed protein product [Phytophthora lilii]|uniref:HECT-type E3 ubiquitin transferase n=1 Tax=Phytophthora lilii TaxID=2077276 RepID=A0A9W6TDK1_9STRA|nr:unnamed protein product [Phytophthora lilii]
MPLNTGSRRVSAYPQSTTSAVWLGVASSTSALLSLSAALISPPCADSPVPRPSDESEIVTSHYARLKPQRSSGGGDGGRSRGAHRGLAGGAVPAHRLHVPLAAAQAPRAQRRRAAAGADRQAGSGGVGAAARRTEGDAETKAEVALPSHGEADSVIKKLEQEVKLVKVEAVCAEEADALKFATGLPSSRNVDVKGLLDLSREDFPTKFAHFVTCTSSLIVPAELEVLKLFLRREHVVEESMEYLCCMDDSDTRSVVRIDFAKETGVDAGGVHREWFTLVTELVIDPSLGVFTCTNHEAQTYFFNVNSEKAVGEEHLAYFFAVGRLVGRALLEGEVMGFHFTSALLKLMLGIPITFRDYEDLDPVTYKSLLWMLEHDGAETLGLDFTATRRDASGNIVTVELLPNGANMSVTDANKHTFAKRWLHYFLLESVSSQLYVFLKGLYQVIPRQMLMLFDAEEFDYMLCGCDSIDVTDWEAHTRCSKNLRGTRVLRWFWELVRHMQPDYRRRLLQFATGCSRVPIGGFRHLTSHDGQICPFTLKGVHSTYIQSHACFNRLDLPMASSRSELKEVLYATLCTETYGFTTA